MFALPLALCSRVLVTTTAADESALRTSPVACLGGCNGHAKRHRSAEMRPTAPVALLAALAALLQASSAQPHYALQPMGASELGEATAQMRGGHGHSPNATLEARLCRILHRHAESKAKSLKGEFKMMGDVLSRFDSPICGGTFVELGANNGINVRTLSWPTTTWAKYQRAQARPGSVILRSYMSHIRTPPKIPHAAEPQPVSGVRARLARSLHRGGAAELSEAVDQPTPLRQYPRGGMGLGGDGGVPRVPRQALRALGIGLGPDGEGMVSMGPLTCMPARHAPSGTNLDYHNLD